MQTDDLFTGLEEPSTGSIPPESHQAPPLGRQGQICVAGRKVVDPLGDAQMLLKVAIEIDDSQIPELGCGHDARGQDE